MQIMYFIGVTTGQSSIMKVFPVWASILGLDAQILGIDLPIHAPVEQYRTVVDFIKLNKNVAGALVTTHKMDLYNAAGDIFESLDGYARNLGEISSISKNSTGLFGSAKDPISSGLALESMLPSNYWVENPEAEALIFGAGGSSLALSVYLTDPARGVNRPKKIVITNRSEPRLAHAKAIHDAIGHGVEIEYRFCPEFTDNDAVLAQTPAGSLIANSTGLGKDRPGSPVTDAAVFPENACVWEFNYRGDLTFMVQADAQKKDRNLKVEDGWIYFIHGWTQVIAEVFDLTLTPELIQTLSEAAIEVQRKK